MTNQLKNRLRIAMLLAGVGVVIILVMVYAYLCAPDDNQPEKGAKPYILLIGSLMRPNYVFDFIYVS